MCDVSWVYLLRLARCHARPLNEKEWNMAPCCNHYSHREQLVLATGWCTLPCLRSPLRLTYSRRQRPPPAAGTA
jgi:hypothetical protein